MTFSIAARCAESGMFVLAVSSSSPAVAARCAFARSGVGAVASQNIVALCDVDETRAAGMFNRFPKAKRFKD